MKKNLRLALIETLLFSLVAIPAHAEMPKGLGLHLGLNIADVSMNSTIQTGSTLGYVVGGTYDYGISPDLIFQPGAQIIQRGFSFDVGAKEIDLKITYLEFPLLFQARFQGAAIIPFFIGGPVIGLKLSTDCSVAGGTCTIYDDTGVKSSHLGLEMGGGAIFPLENGSAISAQVRYHLGLTRVASGLPDPRHRGILIEAGYLF